MAATPRFKVFSPQGEYIAACKNVEDAAALVALYGDGATIRDGHRNRDIVWAEGVEDQPASESYDNVAIVVERKLAKKYGRESRL